MLSHKDMVIRRNGTLCHFQETRLGDDCDLKAAIRRRLGPNGYMV